MKYLIKLHGLADMTALVCVEAASEDEAVEKAQTPDVLMEVEWAYAEMREVTDASVEQTL